MKILIVSMLVLILISLSSAGLFILRDRGKTRNSAWALTVRVGLSVTLFLIILGAYQMGWIQPHGVLIR